MAMDLLDWEDRFCDCLKHEGRLVYSGKAGALLSTIPGYEDWHAFLDSVQAACGTWLTKLGENPHCIVVLYGGLAFYEYEEGRFWPHFEKAVGQQNMCPNKQKNINAAFACSAERLGLPVFHHPGWTDFVGSAVFHIGVPLSLWDGFLDICEWAVYEEGWRELSDPDWSDAVSRRTGGRKRLATFLGDSRAAATAVIQEMLDARKVLAEDKSLTLDGIKGACFLRPEYFDYVPETADFLRPDDPQSLLRSRPRIRWNDQRAQISVHLPPIRSLPATWHVGGISQPALHAADLLPLNSSAFASTVTLKLELADARSEQWVLRGARPWAIFDVTEGWMANPNRHTLPVRAYDILTQELLAAVERRGFNDQEYEPNELYELEDGTRCYRTHLDPTLRSASVSFVHDGTPYNLCFCDTSKLEARVYPGSGYQAAFFRWSEKRMKLVRLPLVCVGIPHDYFQDVASFVCEKMRVSIGDVVLDGKWEQYYEDDLREFWIWRATESAGMCTGKQSLIIQAPGVGVIEQRTLEFERPKPGLDDAWRDLPGRFLPWFVLCQKPEGMTRAEIEHARSAIAPEGEVGYWQLREYAQYGFFRQRGHYWSVLDSRAVLTTSRIGECELQFCGNPSILWGAFRIMKDRHRTADLPVVEVAKERGYPAFLRMKWGGESGGYVLKYLKTHKVRIVSSLWERQPQ
jgi:hypothetical protein